ncbi:MAG: aspartate-semialdehyde dehydrogenase [Bacteroidetes bacterium]|nr:MAG: aspartate-semialdehyde dehydrogenase [Bacteroidota bacterium]
MKLAIIGATGLVGREVISVIEELNFNYDDVILVASEKSVGQEISVNDKPIKVISLEEAVTQKPDIALFSAGGEVSLEWAPKFRDAGTTVIDNSSTWRMDPDIKLVVPEINGDTITKNDKIIANPNCSTIQLVMVLAPLHKKFRIKRVVVSTYQSVSGSGAKGIQQMENERSGTNGVMKYPHVIDKNCIPHCDDFTENGYTKEELKVINETCKILGDENIKVTVTAVRVPVTRGHSEAVNIEFHENVDLEEVTKIMKDTPGLIVMDNPQDNEYPMPINAHNKNDVFVGRIRKDFSQDNSINLWIVADNLRKGAATNAVQIAKYVSDNILMSPH